MDGPLFQADLLNPKDVQQDFVPATDDSPYHSRTMEKAKSTAGQRSTSGTPEPNSEEDKENIDPGPTLSDLFADEPAPAPSSSRSSRPPPHVHSSKPTTEIFDLTTSDHDDEDAVADNAKDKNEDGDEYDFDDLPFPDIDFSNDWDQPGPSKARPTRQSPDRDYERRSSPMNPPPIAHPIMLISDLPPEVQEFYNNHWRRGADRKRKVSLCTWDVVNDSRWLRYPANMR